LSNRAELLELRVRGRLEHRRAGGEAQVVEHEGLA
jgi:hypothetical protein